MMFALGPSLPAVPCRQMAASVQAERLVPVPSLVPILEAPEGLSAVPLAMGPRVPTTPKVFYFMAAVVVVNLAATPETVWFVWPGVG